MTRALMLCLPLVAACAADPQAATVRQYALALHANGEDVVASLRTLKTAVDAFTDSPSAAGLAAAQQAWLDARPSYGQLEVSRFYNGPIDDVQGRVNEWPIDENFIDYTAGNPSGGIINLPAEYPQLTPQVLATSDERGGIENLSTGYHALEFLLWGQRLDQTEGPGQRPYTDYLDGGTAANQGRRRTYLKSATDLLLSDLIGVTAQWDLDTPGSYAATLVASPPHDGLTKILRGFASMAISELYFERMTDPYLTQNRKDEQSCFSESTLVDLQANALGVENVYLGRYGALHGASLSDLVKAKNPTLDGQLRQQLAASRAAIDAIPPPFDHAVLAPATSDAHQKVKAALDTFAPMIDTLHAVADLLGVMVNI